MINSLIGRVTPAPGPRILWLDVARTAAIVAMVVYHFSWDLALFGVIDGRAVTSGPLRILAILTAASFLFLAGVGLVVAHGRGIRWRAFWTRFAILVAAAALITVATFVFQRGAFIFFGILHSIAICSLLGLAFLRLPAFHTFGIAVFFVWLPFQVSLPAFDHPALIWLGLGTYVPRTLDFEPIFPWFGAFLAGMAAGRALEMLGYLTARPLTGLQKWLAWPGQQSLKLYLIHQPVLIACLWVVLVLF